MTQDRLFLQLNMLRSFVSPLSCFALFLQMQNLWGKKEFFKIYFSFFNFKVLCSGIVQLATWYSEIELLALPLLIGKGRE